MMKHWYSFSDRVQLDSKHIWNVHLKTPFFFTFCSFFDTDDKLMNPMWEDMLVKCHTRSDINYTNTFSTKGAQKGHQNPCQTTQSVWEFMRWIGFMCVYVSVCICMYIHMYVYIYICLLFIHICHAHIWSYRYTYVPTICV